MSTGKRSLQQGWAVNLPSKLNAGSQKAISANGLTPVKEV